MQSERWLREEADKIRNRHSWDEIKLDEIERERSEKWEKCVARWIELEKMEEMQSIDREHLGRNEVRQFRISVGEF